MIIVVPSVHHTGTKLVFNDILRDLVAFNQQDKTPRDSGKLRIHIDAPFLEDLHYWCAKCSIIVPIKHPRDVAIGWKVRFKKLGELAQQWTWLKEEIAPYDPLYLPIDLPDRDEWLDKVNLKLNLKLNTDWPVIGRCDDPRPELDESEKTLVNSWMADGFFEQFGYN